jgi:hypothetical protein
MGGPVSGNGSVLISRTSPARPPLFLSTLNPAVKTLPAKPSRKIPEPLDCPHCGSPGVMHTDCESPVAYCRWSCPESSRFPRQYRNTPRAAVMAWNAQVRTIKNAKS